MTPFLQETITSIRTENPSFSNAIYILPSKRAKNYLLDALTAHLEKPCFVPTIYSIEEFIGSLSQLKKAPQLELLFSLYAAYQKIMPKDQQERFDLFLQWSSPLLKDFNDIDAFLIDSENILSDLKEYYALEATDENKSDTPFSSSFWNSLPLIFREFTASLLTKNWGTMGMLYREALDGIQIYLDQTSQHHYFIGFNALNMAEEYLFQEFLAAQKGKIYWDLDHQFFVDSTHACGRFIQRYQKKWTYYRNTPYSFEKKQFSSPKNIQARGFMGNIAQAQYVGELLDKEINTNQSTVVVLGNENFLTPVLAHLPNDFNEWNVTMGWAITELPLVRFFQDFIHLHSHAVSSGIDRKILHPLFDYLPLSRYLNRQFSHHKVALKNLINGQGDVILQNEHPWLLTDHIGALLFGEAPTPSALIEKGLALLEKMRELFFSIEKNTVSVSVIELIKKCLGLLDKQIQASPFEVNNSALALLFQEQISTQKVDFKGDPIAGVQFMGMLETRTLDFKNVIITNLNEGTLPVGKNDQSFFPFALKKHYGLPTFLDNDSIYTYHFYRLLQRAENIYLLYNAKSEGLDAGEKSRFIHQLTYSDISEHQFSDQLIPPVIASFVNPPQEIIKDESMHTALIALAKEGFSPTSLSSYLVNPMDFYTRYLLNIKDVPPAGGTLSHFKRGEIVHNTLESLYKPFLGKQLLSSDYDDMLSRLSPVLMHHYKKENPIAPQLRGENLLIVKAYERAVKQFLMEEKKLVVAGDKITIIALEKKFKEPLPKHAFSFPVYIKGKIDRIDRYNGQLRIIDYKTGSVEQSKLILSDWTKFKGDYKYQALFQVLLYAWALKQEGLMKHSVKGGIVSLKSPKETILSVSRKGHAKNENSPAIDQTFILEIQKFIIELVQEIFDEQKSFVSLK